MTQLTKSRILYSLISILVAWCMAFTAGGTFSVGAGGGEACSGNKGNTAQTEDGYDAIATNMMIVIKITLDCAGTPATINFRTKYLNGNVKFIIYSVNGADPGSLLYASAAVACGNPSSTTTISDTSCDYNLSAGSYYVGVVSAVAGRVYRSSTTGGDGFSSAPEGAYSSPPESWPTATDAPTTSNLMIWMTF